MNPQLAFQPVSTLANPPDNAKELTVTASAQALTLPVGIQPNGTMRLVNTGTASISWCYGNKTGLTMATGVQMLPNTSEIFALPGDVTQITVIGSDTGSTLSVCAGNGK